MKNNDAIITAVWLQQILSPRFPDVDVQNLHVERIGETYGLASHIFRCRWQTGVPPRSVVVKRWNLSAKAGQREIMFYRTFGHRAGARIPACFASVIDTEREVGILLLEDLGNVTQGDCLQQLSQSQAQRLARRFANIHATWLANHELENAVWLPAFLPWQRDAGWFDGRRTKFLARFGNKISGAAGVLLNQIEQVPAIMNDRLTGVGHTLLHADLHLDNLLFTHEGEPVILDWANCGKGPFVFDLVQLLFEIGRLEDVESVLAAYLQAFAASGGGRLAETAVRHQLGAAILRKFAIATCGVANWQPASSREAAMIETGIRRAVQMVEYWFTQDADLFSLAV